MAMDFSGILSSAPQLFRDLPFLINLTQFIFYAGLVLTFGGLVMKGYRGQLAGWARVCGRLLFGVLALVIGISISYLFPPVSDILVYQIIQNLFLNTIPGGLIASGILYLALRLASHNIFNIPGIERSMERLRHMKDKALKTSQEDSQKGRRGLRHPVRIAGVALLLGFVAVGLIFFQGFPNPLEEFGMNEDDISKMADQLDDINSKYGDRIGEIAGNSDKLNECMGALSLLDNRDALSQAQDYTNPEVEQMIEDYSGESVSAMVSLDVDGSFYVFGLTETQGCLATLTTVCLCEDISQDIGSVQDLA